MNHLLVFRGLLRSTLFVASILPGQDRHDPLRVLRTMEVEGLAAFDRDRIAGALTVDGTLLRELQRPLDDEAAVAIAARVQELHRLGGYLQAKAQADVAAGVVTVQLAAGPRSSCGPVRIDDNSAVPTARLRDALAARTDDKAAWTEGAFPTAAVDAVQRRAVAVVTAVYRDLGRHGVRVQAEVGPEEGALVLRVRITDEGREVRVQRLALDGDDDAAKDVLAAVSFAPGALADTAWLVATQRQIERSGRYFDVRPVLVDPMPATLEPLVFAVKLRPNAPVPGALAPADVAQLQAMFDTVLADLRAGRLLELNTELREDDAPSWLRVLPGPVERPSANSPSMVRLSISATSTVSRSPSSTKANRVSRS